MALYYYTCDKCGWHGNEYQCFPDSDDEDDDGCPNCGGHDLSLSEPDEEDEGNE